MNELSQFSLAPDFQKANKNVFHSIDQMRWMIRHRHENGLADYGAVVKRQGRWYVHAGRFEEWMLGGDCHRFKEVS